MFEIRGYSVIREIDDFEEGCIGQPYFDIVENFFLSEKIIAELFEKLKDIFEISMEDISVYENAVEVQRAETFAGATPTEAEICLWKQGKKKLYLARYSFFVKEVKEIDLSSPANKVCGVNYYV